MADSPLHVLYQVQELHSLLIFRDFKIATWISSGNSQMADSPLHVIYQVQKLHSLITFRDFKMEKWISSEKFSSGRFSSALYFKSKISTVM